MFCKCKKCGRNYEYNSEVGYDRELCGPVCDGSYSAVACIKKAMKNPPESVCAVDVADAVRSLESEYEALRAAVVELLELEDIKFQLSKLAYEDERENMTDKLRDLTTGGE